jgi:hypothetical protein
MEAISPAPSALQKNLAIRARIQAAFDVRAGLRVGDFARWPNGEIRRCSHSWGETMQTSKTGSFYMGESGFASFSGALQPAQLKEFFKPTEEVMDGEFWCFSEGIVGAGRAWYFTLPCRVFRLAPFAMDEHQARAHPLARQSEDFWGANTRGHMERLQDLIDPPVLRNPDFY